MKDKLNKLAHSLGEQKQQDDTSTKSKDVQRFVLMYNALHVGTLTAPGNVWNFEYSRVFQLQEKIRPLISFPDKSKVYQSSELWDYFTNRLPTANQSKVKQFAEKYGIEAANDMVALLKNFGHKVATDPFTLSPV